MDPQQDPRELITPGAALQVGLEGGLQGPVEVLDEPICLRVVGTGEVVFHPKQQSD